MLEATCQFGPDNTLFGVLSRPRCHRRHAPAVLLLTAGLLHHVGPYRLYVHVARKLSNLGFTVLRFDLGGVGDSEISRKSGSVSERSMNEITAAMDFLQHHYSIDRFVAMGLCSGADDSLRIAGTDPRITGCLLIDGLGYRTKGFYLRHCLLHYSRRIFSLQKWKHLTRRHIKRRDMVDMEDIEYREFPKKKIAEQQLFDLTTRGVNLCFIYTGGVSDYYNYGNQFNAMFPLLTGNPMVDLTYFPTMDHMAILQLDRRRLMKKIIDWVNNTYPPGMDAGTVPAAAAGDSAA